MQSARDRARSAPDDGSNEWDLSEEVEDPRERGHANPPEASVDSSSIDTTTHADLDSPAVASTMTNDVPEAMADGTDSSVLTVLGVDPLSLQFSQLWGEDAVSEFPIMAGTPEELAKLLDEVHWEETKSAIKRAAQGRQLKRTIIQYLSYYLYSAIAIIGSSSWYPISSKSCERSYSTGERIMHAPPLASVVHLHAGFPTVAGFSSSGRRRRGSFLTARVCDRTIKTTAS